MSRGFFGNLPPAAHRPMNATELTPESLLPHRRPMLLVDEILTLADRVIVMNAGRVSGELPIDQCSENALGCLMGGAELAQAA